MACEIHLNDIGTAFRLTIIDCDSVAIDVSSAIGSGTKEIIFKKPDGTVVIKAAVFYTDGIDGVLDYITIADDLNATGKWKVQAKVTLATGTWSSNIETFKVFANL
jgi:hypothetical protein